MDAIEVQKGRVSLSEGVIAEIVIWRLPEPVRGSGHYFKYRLALIVDDVCVLRYDNEAGKGDHRHYGDEEHPYRFVDVSRLVADFLADVASWREQ